MDPPSSVEATLTDNRLSVGTVTVTPSRVLRVLGATAMLLALLSFGLQVVRLQVPDTRLLHLINFLDVDREQNLPSFFSGVLLLFACLLLTLIASLRRQQHGTFVAHWTGLAIGFFGMAADEMISLHERLGQLMLSTLGSYLPSFLYFAWMIPASVMVLGLAVVYLPFVRSLPARTRVRCVLAGALYLFGALGMEMVGSAIFTANDGSPDSLLYALSTTVEEGCEMLGVAIFIYALLDYLAANYGRIEARLG